MEKVNRDKYDQDMINECMLLSCHLRISEWIYTI